MYTRPSDSKPMAFLGKSDALWLYCRLVSLKRLAIFIALGNRRTWAAGSRSYQFIVNGPHAHPRSQHSPGCHGGPETSAAPATLNFFADQTGAPLSLPLSFPQPDGGTATAASSFTQTLAAGASRVIVSDGAENLLTGSAQLTTTGYVSGFVIFRHNDQEAVVPLESRNAKAY